MQKRFEDTLEDEEEINGIEEEKESNLDELIFRAE